MPLGLSVHFTRRVEACSFCFVHTTISKNVREFVNKVKSVQQKGRETQNNYVRQKAHEFDIHHLFFVP